MQFEIFFNFFFFYHRQLNISFQSNNKKPKPKVSQIKDFTIHDSKTSTEAQCHSLIVKSADQLIAICYFEGT